MRQINRFGAITVKNSIRVSTQFDFRGESFTPEMVVDLDAMMASGGEVPNLYLLLAKENQIGLYSYEYEVLESSELIFSHATDEAAEFLHNNLFDFEGYCRHWQAQQQLEALRNIAREHMGVESLEQQPGLQNALLAAYRLGQATPH